MSKRFIKSNTIINNVNFVSKCNDKNKKKYPVISTKTRIKALFIININFFYQNHHEQIKI